MTGVVEDIMATVLPVLGLGSASWYLWRTWGNRKPAVVNSPLDAPRPWRRWGAILCAAISALVYVGMRQIDPGHRPRAFVILWGVVLCLVFCLCILAGVDIYFTRRWTRQTLQTNRDQRSSRDTRQP
ncbi:MAG: DUF4184 family protein [bacterium]|nr:DUF4184 family protein [bacterium]